MREILILGGGASGLAAAIGAAQTGGGGVRVTLVEQNPAPGKKLLATGNGRCNYDNLASGEAERYFTASPAALRALLESIGRQDLSGWWHGLGLVGRADEAGRLYPYSNQAADLTGLLLRWLDALGVARRTGCRVTELGQKGRRYAVRVEAEGTDADLAFIYPIRSSPVHGKFCRQRIKRRMLRRPQRGMLDRQMLLEAPGLLARSRKLLEILIRDQQLLELKQEIQEKVKQEIDKQQRDYYLQQQMKTIQQELNDGDDDDIERMREAAKKKNWNKATAELFEKELGKVERLNPAVAEYSVQMTYLQLMLDLPWNDVTKDNLDLKCAREQLDADHFGLEEVKERILEHLAVIKLKGDLKSPIIALGGLHDEAEIRGHRRTYIGALPGRVIETIKRCGSSNPVIILDEVDKITVSNHGDPSSALLEVLDPEQNTTFHDNYLDTEYDLSKVLFIATANDVGAINPALRDRMELISIPGYILEDKVQIASKHLIKKQCEAHGLKESDMVLSDGILKKIISEYTRESGVRALDKSLAKLARSRAKNIAFEEEYTPEFSAADIEKILGKPKYLNEEYEIKDMVGIVTGLAWTQVGGDILYIESILTPGKGKISLTGNLGDVMKESATIAREWVMAHYEELGIDKELFETTDLNIHVPEGAIPKDGPSAGITMITSIVSTYTGRKVRERIAMTGETTLRGRVMPIGGVKEKILAAKRAGIVEVLLPEENRKDVEEIKKEYLEGLTFHYVRTNNEVLELALEKR